MVIEYITPLEVDPLFLQDQTSREIEAVFAQMMDTFHSLPEVWDNKLDRQIHEWYANAPEVYPKYPYFSPSSVYACPRSLYYKDKRVEKDDFPIQPHQARWQRAGTSTGDWVQRDILMIESKFEEMTGYEPPFVFKRTEKGEPFFEEFAKANVPIEVDVDGTPVSYYMTGSPDGIMKYTTIDGDEIEVGLEIKSKQTTPARTSQHSMRSAEIGHILQAITYSIMYDVDYYVVVYFNLAKKTWKMDEEEYEKTPDMRVFAYHFDEYTKDTVKNHLATLRKMFDEGKKPYPDIMQWSFNPYKVVTAKDLSDEEYDQVVEQVRGIVDNKNLRMFEKKKAREALSEINTIRKFYELDVQGESLYDET